MAGSAVNFEAGRTQIHQVLARAPRRRRPTPACRCAPSLLRPRPARAGAARPRPAGGRWCRCRSRRGRRPGARRRRRRSPPCGSGTACRVASKSGPEPRWVPDIHSSPTTASSAWCTAITLEAQVGEVAPRHLVVVAHLVGAVVDPHVADQLVAGVGEAAERGVDVAGVLGVEQRSQQLPRGAAANFGCRSGSRRPTASSPPVVRRVSRAGRAGPATILSYSGWKLNHPASVRADLRVGERGRTRRRSAIGSPAASAMQLHLAGPLHRDVPPRRLVDGGGRR